VGIAAEHMPHIFDRMYRVDSARDRSAGGTGLGLAIVKGLVDALDARIDVQSTPGEGSTFRVLLPLEVAAA
jgi:signal transduction histidine kinase